MQIGVVILPEHSWPVASAMWRRAEELGFHHAWTYDHIAWGSLRDSPWFSAVPTLTGAALVTSNIRLGTLVASPNFRHPVPFAREVITLDDISQGRLALGLGAGGQGWDATILGQDPWSPKERLDRFSEFVDLLDELLREPSVTRRGRFYSAEEARSHPGCVQKPRVPFAVAATGRRGMRIAARHGDTWVTNGDRGNEGPALDASEGAALLRRQMSQLDEICEAEGRPPGTLRRLVLTGPRIDAGLDSPQQFADTWGAYAEVGVTDFVVPWPRPTDPYRGDPTILERIAPGA